MNEKTMTRADFVSSLVLIVFGAYVTFDSWRMPRFAEQKANAWSAPGLVPGILGLLFLLLGGILLARSLRRGGHRFGVTAQAVRSMLGTKGVRDLASTLMLCLLYGAVFLGHLPFDAATGIFVFLFIYIAEFKRPRPLRAELRAVAVAAAIAVPTAVVVTYVFQNLFLVNLP
jgi:putative tricarboxylic transport membrane protein